MGLGKPGRLRVDQPTITVELGPAPDAYTHYSPVMIAALSKTARSEVPPAVLKACLATWSCITGRTAPDGPTCWSIGHINGFWLKLNCGATN
jgi:hypothetical protein